MITRIAKKNSFASEVSMNKNEFKYTIDSLMLRYPKLLVCKADILAAYYILCECFEANHKLLIAGNGGSCADSEHIVGELMKGFKKKRPVSEEFASKLKSIDPTRGGELADKLQMALPSIALDGHQSLNTAFANDIEGGSVLAYAQQINGYGNKGDVLVAISTSGNSKNILYAAVTAKAKGMKVISLTGESGGALVEFADTAIKAPSNETFIVQEYHLPIYHCICLMLEERFF